MCRSFFLLATLLIASAPTWADDDLTRFVQRNQLAAQQLKSEVKLALTDSRVLEKSDLNQAKQLLENLRLKVRDSQILTAEDRGQLSQQLQARLGQLGEIARQRRVAEEEATQKAIDAARVRTSPLGKEESSSVAKSYIEAGNKQRDAAFRIKIEREKGVGSVLDSIQNSATPITGDIAFAKDWREKSEIRKKFAGPQLTEKEVALMKAMNSTISIEFKETSFKDALNLLQERTGMPIIVDATALKDAMVEYDDPVTFKVSKVTVRTVLKKLLGDKNLAYLLQEGTVQVVTPQRARDTMVVRTYPVSDLVSPGQMAMFGPFVAQAQIQANVNTLIQTIQSTVEPSMWAANGGPATISFIPASQSLIIRASAEMHYSLGGSMFGR